MKRIFALITCALLLTVAGCRTNTAPTPPLAPGYTNTADQSMGETLAAARGFYARLQSDAVAGTFKPSATETRVLGDLGTAINYAEPLYLAYHNGTGSQAAAQAAVNSVMRAQASAQAQIQAVK